MTEIKEADMPLEEKSSVANETQPLTGQPTTNTNLSKTALDSILVFRSTGALIFFCVLAALPIAQIIIGQRFMKDCPVNPNIPIYQIVSGSIGLANILIILITGVASTAFIKPAMKAVESNSDTDAMRLSVGYSCLVCCAVMIQALLALFMTIWTILGLVWLFSSWNTVQYLDPNQVTYCNSTLYRFHFWLFILPFILVPVICCIPCCIVCCAVCAVANTRSPVQPATP